VEGRDAFMKAMELNFVLRQVAKLLPNFDMIYFRDCEGFLKSHCAQFGKVVEETYTEGGKTSKEFKGVKTTVTYHWQGDHLCYTVAKDGAPDEETKSDRWVEPCGKVMRATTEFRKNASKPWTVLKRTWYLDETGSQ